LVHLMTREDIHSFRNLVKDLSNEDVSRCYQCGKCTAGCPVAIDMDISPNQVMRLVQINSRDRVLASSTIWLCLSCETCTTRCPADIDIARVMDTLRKISVNEGYSSSQPAITKFNKIFLDSIKKHGRLSELELSVRYSLVSRQLFNNIGLALNLLRKGKIHPFGQNIKDRNRIKDIFAKSQRFIRGKS
jgi:heterodisulfide reductase subunit C